MIEVFLRLRQIAAVLDHQTQVVEVHSNIEAAGNKFFLDGYGPEAILLRLGKIAVAPGHATQVGEAGGDIQTTGVQFFSDF